MLTNTTAGKVLNLLDECAARCVHLPPKEEECTPSSWRDSKMYTTGSIKNTLRMLPEINEIGAIANVEILVEKDSVKHVKY